MALVTNNMAKFKSRIVKIISFNGDFIADFNYDVDYHTKDLLKEIKNLYFQDKELIQLKCMIGTYILPSIFDHNSRRSVYEMLIENNIYYSNIIITIIIIDIEKEVILMYKNLHYYKQNGYDPNRSIEIYDDEFDIDQRYNNNIGNIIRIYIQKRFDIMNLLEAIMLIYYNNSIIKFLPNIFRNNKEYVLEIIRYFPIIYNDIDLVLKNDIDIINVAINNDGLILQYIDDKFKNKEIIEKAISNNENSIIYVPKNLITSRMIINIIKDNIYIYDNFYDYEYIKNKEKYSLEDNIFKYIPENILNIKLILRIFKINHYKRGINETIDDYNSEDEFYTKKSTSLNQHIYKYLPNEFKNNDKIALYSISIDIDNYKYLPEEKKLDINFIKKLADLKHSSSIYSLLNEDMKNIEITLYFLEKNIKIINIINKKLLDESNEINEIHNNYFSILPRR